MDRASFAIAARAADLLADIHGGVYGSEVLLLVGPGANGGDALFAGAHLAKRGAVVSAWMSGAKAHTEAMTVFLAAGGRIGLIDDADLIIDGIVGMGSKGALEELPELPDSFLLSIDLPSGVHPDSGVVDGLHIDADLTLATGAYKVAHLVDPAHSSCGVIELIDLDLDFSGEEAICESWQSDDVADLLGAIEVDPSIADKYRNGVLGICAGSEEFPGAGILCTDAALSAGVGMVRYYSSVEIRSERPEVVVGEGKCQALVVGPGLTEFEKARDLLQSAFPAVVDAGAIEFVADARPDTVVTPHAGELARLLQVDRSWVEANRLEAAQKAAQQLGCIVLLKGSTTVIAATDAVAVNPTGSSALATAGSGDVLAGIIGAFLARGANAFDAAVAGAWIHGIAGAHSEELNLHGGASSIASMIPVAIESIRQY